jgi:hypothetical protein
MEEGDGVVPKAGKHEHTDGGERSTGRHERKRQRSNVARLDPDGEALGLGKIPDLVQIRSPDRDLFLFSICFDSFT